MINILVSDSIIATMHLYMPIFVYVNLINLLATAIDFFIDIIISNIKAKYKPELLHTVKNKIFISQWECLAVLFGY